MGIKPIFTARGMPKDGFNNINKLRWWGC